MKTVFPFIPRQTSLQAGTILVTLVLLCCASLMQVKAQNQRSEFHESYPLAASGSVSVTNVSGWIRITGWGENKVQVDAIKRARRSEDLDKVEIQVSASPERVDIRTVYPRFSSSSVSVDYEIRVPRSAILNGIVSTSGDISITDIKARVTTRSTSGNLTVRDIGGDATLSTTSGDIVAEKISSALTINSTSGNIRAQHIDAQFRSRTTSGDVQAEDIRDDADASSTSGNVTLLKVGGRATARSTSGTITLNDIAGDVEAGSTSDSIHVSRVKGRVAASTVSGDIIVQGAGEGFQGNSVSGNMQISDTTGRIEAGSTSGDISIQSSASEEIRVRTHSGDVRFRGQLAGGGRYDFTSFSGDVLLLLPASSDFEILAKTSSGSIETDFPLTLEAGSIGGGNSRRLQAVHGKGGARLSLTGFSANLRIKKQ